MKGSDCVYSFARSPSSLKTVHSGEGTGKKEEIVALFNSWIELIKKYHTIEIDDDDFEKQYQEEFYSYFEIVDEDAEVNPFELKRQLLLDQLLDVALVYIEKDADQNGDLEELRKEVVAAKENLHNETKKVVIRRLSKIYAKFKKNGIPFLKGLLMKVKDEAIKRGIDWGFDQFGRLLDN